MVGHSGKVVVMQDPKSSAAKVLALLDSGQPKAAAKAARQAAKAFPREGFFANLEGLALAQTGAQNDAVDAFGRAVRLAPGSPDFQNNLVQALIVARRLQEAESLARRWLPGRRERAARAALVYLLAMALTNAGRFAEAEQLLDDALAADPDEPRLLTLRGVARFEQGREAAARADYERALAIRPDAVETLTNLSLVLSRAGQDGPALAAVDKALAVAPRNLLALQRRANLLNEAGRTEEARLALRRMLDVVPGHPEALLELAGIVPPEGREALGAEVLRAAGAVPARSIGAAQLALARARLALASGRSAEADKLFAEGNAGIARHQPFDIDAARREYEAILRLVPDASGLPAGVPAREPAPIFVLGLPRSGTTLVEQMVSAHPLVHGAGELGAAGRAAAAIVAAGGSYDAEAAARFEADYRAALPPMPADIGAFVDKMPSNYRLIGLILGALANATILHIRRDPRDVGLSMWHTVFTNPGMAYTFDQKAMAAQLNLYRRYMRHWDALFPDRIVQIDYEALVADPEGQSRRIASACGLEWVADMAHPERNTRAVRTASLQQVRAPVHRRSLAGWRRHAEALDAFIAALDPALWPELGAS
jgi:Flp pilus assembly protein TadD